MNSIKTLFSKDRVNSSRQIEWDYVKFIAILIMIFYHSVSYCDLTQGYDPNITLLVLTFLSFLAPSFMVSMGITMNYSRKQAPEDYIRRGIKILLAGLLINILYFLSDFGAGLGLYYSGLSLLSNDILQLAGFTFILVGIFKKLGLNNKHIFLVSVVFAIIGSIFRGYTSDNLYLIQILGQFVGTYGFNVVSAFPLLNWFIVPAGGLLLGDYLIRCEDKNQLYKKLIIPFILITAIVMIIGLTTGLGCFAIKGGLIDNRLAFFHCTIFDSIFYIIVSLTFAFICYYFNKVIKNRFDTPIKLLVNNILPIYVSQWILILLLIYINQFLQIQSNAIITTVVLIGIIVISIIMAETYSRIKRMLIKN